MAERPDRITLAFHVRWDALLLKWRATCIADPSIDGMASLATGALTAAFVAADKRARQLEWVDPAVKQRRIYRMRLRAGYGRRQPTLGWQVVFRRYLPGGTRDDQRTEVLASRYFGDDTWGGSGYALAQAIQFRDAHADLLTLSIGAARRKAARLKRATINQRSDTQVRRVATGGGR